jgi:hypothetical protein
MGSEEELRRFKPPQGRHHAPVPDPALPHRRDLRSERRYLLHPTAKPCYYYASDNLQSPAYVGLTPDDLVEIAVDNGLHFDGASQQGVVLHLIGALSEFGKLGTVCIGDSHESARKLYRDTVAVLDRETG